MNVKIENIGFIKKADIDIDGLVVIAGENDSGKSTIGKLLFSIIKSIARYREDLEEDKEKNIKKIVENIYFNIRRRVNFQENGEVRELFIPPKFIKDISSKKIEAIEYRKDYLNKIDLNINLKNNIDEKLLTLEELLKQNDDENEAMKRAFKKILHSEFESDILNRDSQNASIEIIEGENRILDIKINETNNINFDLLDEFYFNDSSFIETPLILNFNEMIGEAKSYFETRDKEEILFSLGLPNVNFHTKDIDLKLKESIYEDDFNENIELFETISNIIGGDIKYSKEDRDFVFFKNKKEKYKNINTASGIKSFGILQMLLKGGFLDERSLLIIDEPEVHLHPKWQLNYAEIITTLVKNGVNIIITTHSPYMLEALEIFSKKEKINSNYYFSKKVNNDIEFYDVKYKLEDVYETLSEPFSKLEELSLDSIFK